MKQLKLNMAGVILFLAAVACYAQSGSVTNDIRLFADHLYAQKDYYRAITEYKRFLFLNPASPEASSAEFQIGMSYLNGEKLELAAQVFSDLADRHVQDEIGRKALMMVAESYSRMKKPREAQDTLEKYLARYPDDSQKESIKVKIGWYLLCQGESKRAVEKLRTCPADSPVRSQAEKLIQEAGVYENLPLKSPLLAGSFSAVLPGAGQVYVGRPRDGLVAFLVNGALIWASAEAFDKDQNFAGSMFALLDVSWYAGNIYNAINSAHKVNRARGQDFLGDAEVKCGLAFSGTAKEGLAPMLALRVSF